MQKLTDADRRALSPLFWSHANLYGSLAGSAVLLEASAGGDARAVRQEVMGVDVVDDRCPEGVRLVLRFSAVGTKQGGRERRLDAAVAG